ncbi:MAG: hypothetical protein IKK92_05590, partial [Prevotella sp.]|nr:hypothetical protein [Prevotella sp.]
MNRMHEMEEKSREANNGNILFTEAESAEYRSLVDESAGLSARAKAMASGKELEQIREREDLGKQLRERIKACGLEKRAESTTILAFPDAENGNTTANLKAGELIPIEILPLIDTKVPGIELPDDLRMATGVTGTQVIPYSVNDVKFTVEGEVTKVAEQALNFANIQAAPVRVAASVPVSFRAIDNAAFDIIAFITFKFQKGWAMFRALHVYAHGEYTKLQSPFGKVDPVELTLDENIGENIAKEIAKMYDKGFEGDPEIIMDKTTEVALKFKKLIPGTTDSNRIVIEDGRCVGYKYKVSPYVDYAIAANGIATKDDEYRYIAIGHFGYLAEQQHGELRFNIDGTSQANFDRGTVAIGMSTDYSLTELSGKVNGGDGTPQAFALIKLVEPASSNEIGN